ncbi:hypothetical protein [Mesorhizobium sp. LNJC391B00]|uniref:hypothetical protein n=1 Tax=Mesorhizobium sp. LNJC391B00 TaxID=1287273 RepID=UPI0003CDDE57|nr:hypothetical protein [Mesorhizobium sp. LNJC391B00]ESY20397.1 hypothetical protein X749_29560 [Mesorhizobium sp. LNJC391B00]
MLLDQFGRPVRYIQKTDIEINAAIAEELRAEEVARSQAEEEAGSYVTTDGVYADLAEYYAERTSLAKMGLPDPNAWSAHNRRHHEASLAEQFVTPAEHQRACAAARSQGFAQGLAESRKAGAAAEGKRFMDIVHGCKHNDARLFAALNLALEFPQITAEGCIDMAGKHFSRGTGSASLANRDSLPDSLAIAKSQLAGA